MRDFCGDLFVEFIVPILLLILVILLVLFTITCPIYLLEQYSCTNYGERTGQRTDYSLVNGCMVETSGTWKPSKNTLEIK